MPKEKTGGGHNKPLVVFPCSTTIFRNDDLKLYYEWSTRPCKRNQRFIGLYTKKTIWNVGKIEAITVAFYKDGEVHFPKPEESGRLTDDHQMLIRRAFATRLYPLKEDGLPRRLYLVDSFPPTEATKVSPGGMRRYRYFDRSDFHLSKVAAYDPRKDWNDYTSEELARELKGATWE